MKYVMRIDHEACWGCKTCEVACKQENEAPAGIKLIHVTEEEIVNYADKLNFRYRVNTCRHCDDPFCGAACPEDAIIIRDDGIVVLDKASCSGCRACVEACPYHVISFDDLQDIARKCNLCSHRVDSGLLPACADNVCPAHCIYFGDPGEIDNLITEKIKTRNKSA